MSVRTYEAVTAAIATVVICTSCLRSLPFNHYILRAPQLAPGDLGEVRVGGRCETQVEGLRIRVSALRTGASSLIVILNFESEEVGYFFDPMRAVIATGNREPMAPRAYVGPGELDWVKGTYRTCVAADHQPPLERRSDSSWHTLPPRDTCFVLEYPIQVVPPATPELRLEAVSRARTLLSPIRFRVGERMLWANVIDVQPVGDH